MSRSYKKNAGSNTTSGDRAGNQKAWKRSASRKLRRVVREMLKGGHYTLMPLAKEVANIWSSPSDGSSYWGGKDVPK